MTGAGTEPRRARIRSDVRAPGTVAAAVAPDDTEDIHTRVEDGAVVATIERPTTASLEATVDDHVVALDVAIEVVRAASPDRDDGPDDGDARTHNRHADTH